MNSALSEALAILGGLAALATIIGVIVKALAGMGKWMGAVDLKLIAIEEEAKRIRQTQQEHRQEDMARFNDAERSRSDLSHRLGVVERRAERIMGKLGMDGGRE